MIRILIFILSAVFVAATLTVLFGIDGLIQTEAFGQKLSIHAGFAAGVAIIVIVGAIFVTVWIKDVLALPSKIEAREREARRLRGIQALTRGLEAVAVGDAADAQHHARVARRNLDESSLTRFLTAQAAQLSGDEETAGDNFKLMLEAPETEFLGLRGLYLLASRAGDKTAARAHAERAFRLRSNAAWAFDSVVDLGLERGAWGETREAIATGAKNGAVAPEKARRAEAALLAADAYAAAASGETATALEEAEAAYKLAPALTPGAVLAAQLHAAAGRRARAAKILEQSFAEAAHPALIKTHERLYADETDDRRAGRLKRIADRRPMARDAKLAYAKAALIMDDFKEAIAILEPLLLETATSGDFALMAQAVASGKEGREADAAARPWLERAAAARRDPALGADGEFHFTREGWARLVREFMEHGRIAPPPLEDAPPGLSEDDRRLLAAPPIVVDAGAGLLSDAAPAKESPLRIGKAPDDPGAAEGVSEEAEAAAARAVAAAGRVS